MAKAETISIDNFLKDLDTRSKEFKDMAGRSLYEGAAILADELRRIIEDLPERKGSVKKGEMARGVTPQQKKALLDHMGVARMQNNDGTYDIKIGFQGYDDDRTKAYPQGHPVSMIARSVESGTSWLQKTPFIKPARDRSQKRAEAAMTDALEKAWNGNT